jgi:hypothetical protein
LILLHFGCVSELLISDTRSRQNAAPASWRNQGARNAQIEKSPIFRNICLIEILQNELNITNH